MSPSSDAGSTNSKVSGLSNMKFGAKFKIKEEVKREKELSNAMYESMCYEATKRVQNNAELEYDKCNELFKELHKKNPSAIAPQAQNTSNHDKNIKRIKELNDRLRHRQESIRKIIERKQSFKRGSP